jgi:hypothetical protein
MSIKVMHGNDIGIPIHSCISADGELMYILKLDGGGRKGALVRECKLIRE